MSISRKFSAALLSATMLAGAASAQTLVYCSEGSPEGFDPALYTAGTTFDASSRQLYNKLVQILHFCVQCRVEPLGVVKLRIIRDGAAGAAEKTGVKVRFRRRFVFFVQVG